MGAYDEMERWFSQLCKTSVLAEHWIKNFIKPLLSLMILYVSAEREAEFGLNLYLCERMMPYFFAAGNFNYARYGLYYINSIDKLPNETLLSS